MLKETGYWTWEWCHTKLEKCFRHNSDVIFFMLYWREFAHFIYIAPPGYFLTIKTKLMFQYLYFYGYLFTKKKFKVICTRCIWENRFQNNFTYTNLKDLRKNHLILAYTKKLKIYRRKYILNKLWILILNLEDLFTRVYYNCVYLKFFKRTYVETEVYIMKSIIEVYKIWNEN